MQGRRVVAIMGVAFIATTALFWGIGLSVQAEVQSAAESQGVPKLSREEAALRAAREDKFGLPSRLENAPDRDIERAWKVGTVDDPFASSTEGIEALFDVYAVTVKGCRTMLPKPEKDAEQHLIYVTLQTVGEHGRVASMHVGTGEPDRTRRFTSCITGGVAQAIFEPPASGEATFSTQVVMPN